MTSSVQYREPEETFPTALADYYAHRPITTHLICITSKEVTGARSSVGYFHEHIGVVATSAHRRSGPRFLSPCIYPPPNNADLMGETRPVGIFRKAHMHNAVAVTQCKVRGQSSREGEIVAGSDPVGHHSHIIMASGLD